MSIREQKQEYEQVLSEIRKQGGVVHIRHMPWQDWGITKGVPRYETLCQITHDGIEAMGVAACCPWDTPNRKLGWTIAVGRALSEYKKKLSSINN